MDPLEILPVELWQMIFSKVQDAQDWLNLYQASPSFEPVVGNDRTRALLTQVFPHVQKYLSDILALRLLSRQWKEAVDKTVELANDNPVNRAIKSNYLFGASSERISRITSFLEKFASHRNPFIGSSVFLYFNFNHWQGGEAEMAKFKSLALRLITRFGNVIKGIEISVLDIQTENDLDHNELDLNDVVCHLMSYVRLTPNLETLSVHFDSNYGIENYRPAHPNPANHQTVPILSKLKSFSFRGFSKAPWRMWMEMQTIVMRMCCNPASSLRKLEMIGGPTEPLAFPNLETAKLILTGLEEENLLTNCLSWPLSRLTLALADQVPLSVVVGCADHFKETLTFLEISGVCQDDVSAEEELGFNNLPRLKTLTIPCNYFATMFRFLQSLPSLEVLSVFQSRVRQGEEELDVKLAAYGVKLKMKKANVWEMLPKLRKIVVTTHPASWKFFCVSYYKPKPTNEPSPDCWLWNRFKLIQ